MDGLCKLDVQRYGLTEQTNLISPLIIILTLKSVKRESDQTTMAAIAARTLKVDITVSTGPPLSVIAATPHPDFFLSDSTY